MKFKKRKWAGTLELEEENGDEKVIQIKYIDINDLSKIQELQDTDDLESASSIFKVLSIYCPEADEEDFAGIGGDDLNKLLVYVTETGTGKKLSSASKKKLLANG